MEPTPYDWRFTTLSWNERKFRGLLPRCQTKNRIKFNSLYDLGISNPAQSIQLCRSNGRSSLDLARNGDLVRATNSPLVRDLTQSACAGINREDRDVGA